LPKKKLVKNVGVILMTFFPDNVKRKVVMWMGVWRL